MVCEPTSDDSHQPLLSETCQVDIAAPVAEEYQADTQSHDENHITAAYNKSDELVNFEIIESTGLYNYLDSSMSQSSKQTPPFELRDEAILNCCPLTFLIRSWPSAPINITIYYEYGYTSIYIYPK